MRVGSYKILEFMTRGINIQKFTLKLVIFKPTQFSRIEFSNIENAIQKKHV